jgi:hypothetical protein
MKRKILSLLSGVALALGMHSAAAQTITTNTLSLTTFDAEGPSAWGYGYFYGDNGLGRQTHLRSFYLPEDADMTNGMWQYTFDLTALEGRTGYGTGTGGPLHRTVTEPGAFTSTNRDDYIFTWSGRVEGLAAGQTGANAEMQVSFWYKNEANADTKSLQVNIPFRPTTQWQTFTVNLEDGALADNTTEAGFARNATNTFEVRFNVNFHEPHTAFGFDDTNAFYLDNARLQMVTRPRAVEPTKTPVTMSEWNFDDKNVTYHFNYNWSQNDIRPVITSGNNANGASTNNFGLNGSSGWFLQFDTTEMESNPPAWAGGGTGGGGPIDFTLMTSTNLADYQVTFQARAEGFAEGKTNSAGILQLHLEAPDDTVQPADENATADAVIRLDFPITLVSSNWQTYTIVFNKANVGSGNRTNFNLYATNVNNIRAQLQVENAGSVTEWGYDANNMLVIDDLKIERLVVGGGNSGDAPTLNVTRQGNSLVLSWSGANYKLQSATSVTGPYTDVTGATSGFSTPITGEQRYFRLVRANQQ